MNDKTFKKITEASYLTAEKVSRYRGILRYFFVQHERMREFLFPEEIFQHLKGMDLFRDYTMDELQQDLEQLVKWNNLNARQEMGHARTIEEFKKKRFRYQCTPYTVEIERMLQKLEQIGESFGGSLERSQFDRLYQALLKIEALIDADSTDSNEEITQMWDDVFHYFRQITQNTSDYIAYINSEQAEERMQSEAFLVFKEQFTTYLRDFIVTLQQTALKIRQLLEAVPESSLTTDVIKKVSAHQLAVPRLNDIAYAEEDLILEQLGKWESLKTWFLGNDQRESEFELLQLRTNETIRRMTRIVQRLGERHHHFRSRKKDYLHLAEWFSSMESLEEAHELSSVVFGVMHTRHLYSNEPATDDIYSDIWDEEPVELTVKPRIRQYREKTRPGAVRSTALEKEAMMLQHLEEKQKERAVIETYMTNSLIRLDQLPVIEPYVRKLLLSWIGKSVSHPEGMVKTEYGQHVKVTLMSNEKIKLHSEDGVLTMPNATFHFTDNGGS